MVVRIYLAVLGIACAANRFVRAGSFAAGAAFRFTGLAYGASVGVLIIPAARPVAPSVAQSFSAGKGIIRIFCAAGAGVVIGRGLRTGGRRSKIFAVCIFLRKAVRFKDRFHGYILGGHGELVIITDRSGTLCNLPLLEMVACAGGGGQGDFRIRRGSGVICGRGAAVRRVNIYRYGKCGGCVRRYLDCQRLADIPRCVFHYDVNILCAGVGKVRKGNGLLGCTAGSSRPIRINGWLVFPAVYYFIVIAARFTAGKLHRRGGFAVAGSRAIGKRRVGGVIGGATDFFKLAGVVGHFIAVVLLVEYIQLYRIA